MVTTEPLFKKTDYHEEKITEETISEIDKRLETPFNEPSEVFEEEFKPNDPEFKNENNTMTIQNEENKETEEEVAEKQEENIENEQKIDFYNPDEDENIFSLRNQYKSSKKKY
jgi:hypothetical protein